MRKEWFLLMTFIEVLVSAGPSAVFGGVLLERTIAAGSDDAEERLDRGHVVDLDSSDLELAWEDEFQEDKQVVGLRFTDIAIPKGTEITEAWVRFDVDETKGSGYPVFLTIEGELSANAATFGEAAHNITDRPRTKAKVQWHVPKWTATHEHGPAQTTPNIAAIIQEIVSQDDWVGGNALVLIFSHSRIVSTGIRCAVSFEGAGSNTDRLPTLTVVPEPATIASLGLGGLALLGFRRRWC